MTSSIRCRRCLYNVDDRFLRTLNWFLLDTPFLPFARKYFFSRRQYSSSKLSFKFGSVFINRLGLQIVTDSGLSINTVTPCHIRQVQWWVVNFVTKIDYFRLKLKNRYSCWDFFSFSKPCRDAVFLGSISCTF